MPHHLVIFGEAHLRQILKAYADYYNQVRTHLALAKDTPMGRPVQNVGPKCPSHYWAAFTTNTSGRDKR